MTFAPRFTLSFNDLLHFLLVLTLSIPLNVVAAKPVHPLKNFSTPLSQASHVDMHEVQRNEAPPSHPFARVFRELTRFSLLGVVMFGPAFLVPSLHHEVEAQVPLPRTEIVESRIAKESVLNILPELQESFELLMERLASMSGLKQAGEESVDSKVTEVPFKQRLEFARSMFVVTLAGTLITEAIKKMGSAKIASLSKVYTTEDIDKILTDIQFMQVSLFSWLAASPLVGTSLITELTRVGFAGGVVKLIMDSLPTGIHGVLKNRIATQIRKTTDEQIEKLAESMRFRPTELLYRRPMPGEDIGKFSGEVKKLIVDESFDLKMQTDIAKNFGVGVSVLASAGAFFSIASLPTILPFSFLLGTVAFGTVLNESLLSYFNYLRVVSNRMFRQFDYVSVGGGVMQIEEMHPLTAKLRSNRDGSVLNLPYQTLMNSSNLSRDYSRITASFMIGRQYTSGELEGNYVPAKVAQQAVYNAAKALVESKKWKPYFYGDDFSKPRKQINDHLELGQEMYYFDNEVIQFLGYETTAQAHKITVWIENITFDLRLELESDFHKLVEESLKKENLGLVLFFPMMSQ